MGIVPMEQRMKFSTHVFCYFIRDFWISLGKNSMKNGGFAHKKLGPLGMLSKETVGKPVTSARLDDGPLFLLGASSSANKSYSLESGDV